MNKGVNISIILFIVIAIAALIFFVPKFFGESEEKVEVAPSGLALARDIARNWVEKESPTYIFDGSGLVLDSEDMLGGGHYRFSFAYKTSHGGYGNREGEVLTQAIVSHILSVEVKNGVVTKAITDGQFDELTEEFLFDPEGFDKG